MLEMQNCSARDARWSTFERSLDPPISEKPLTGETQHACCSDWPLAFERDLLVRSSPSANHERYRGYARHIRDRRCLRHQCWPCDAARCRLKCRSKYRAQQVVQRPLLMAATYQVRLIVIYVALGFVLCGGAAASPIAPAKGLQDDKLKRQGLPSGFRPAL
jgi:hypothetical protein